MTTQQIADLIRELAMKGTASKTYHGENSLGTRIQGKAWRYKRGRLFAYFNDYTGFMCGMVGSKTAFAVNDDGSGMVEGDADTLVAALQAELAVVA